MTAGNEANIGGGSGKSWILWCVMRWWIFRNVNDVTRQNCCDPSKLLKMWKRKNSRWVFNETHETICNLNLIKSLGPQSPISKNLIRSLLLETFNTITALSSRLNQAFTRASMRRFLILFGVETHLAGCKRARTGHHVASRSAQTNLYIRNELYSQPKQHSNVQWRGTERRREREREIKNKK